MPDEEEAALIARARRGDAHAFSSLIARHQQAVRAFLRRLSGGWADGDDLAQEAFAAAWMRLARFEGRSSFRAWLCGIGFRLWRDGRRSDRRRALREGLWVEAQEEAASPAGPESLALRRAVAALPAEQRAAVLLCLAGGWTHEEAAAALGAPLGTVKSHVARGRAKLAAMLGETS